jgi:hypothetical protein
MTAPRDDVIAVDPALLKEFMLDGLHARVTALAAQPLPDRTEELLARGSTDREIARVGYLTRVAETERFAPAREPMQWLSELLADSDPATVAAELAAAEPTGKPAPSDPDAVTWRVPGPGGHVRYFLAARWSEGDDDSRRAWLYGFFLRCCEEASES